jgi:hypothetical protein
MSTSDYKNLKRCFGIVLMARENHLLFGETNSANGKCTMQDEKGQDIPIGDGVIKQIERYCEKFAYSVLTTVG